MLLKAQERNGDAAFDMLRFGFQQISGVQEFFRPSTLQKSRKLFNAQYVYDVQEIAGSISARCHSQVQRMAYDIEIQENSMRHLRAISDNEWTNRLLLRNPK